MLTQEYGTASNIKSRVNRLSVLAAITSTQQRLKLYNRVPPNGLVVYCGTILTDEGKEKKVNIDVRWMFSRSCSAVVGRVKLVSCTDIFWLLPTQSV